MLGRFGKALTAFDSVLERTLAYCFGLGWFHGPRLLVSLLAARLRRLPYVMVRVPTVRSRIGLRPCSSDVAVFTQTFARREYDMATMRQAQDAGWLNPEESRYVVVIDCGANIGLSTVWFATQFPFAKLVAIEPQADNYRVLCANLTGYDAECLQAGVWNENTSLAIANPDASLHAFRVIDATQAEASVETGSISGVTLNEIVSRYPGRRFLVKVDIEGAEAMLFKDNLEWLDVTDLLIVEIHDWLMPWEGTSRNVLRAIVAHQFEVQWRGENMFCFRTTPMQRRTAGVGGRVLETGNFSANAL